ncbi:hypothetical protein [Oceanobacillus damuensis]|uniref:hypothetical protein n=1 Tax=Oceanobacillus damuensis TaxID=937928 RepID=UPI00082B9DFC|nr:hypothetical protein [Oceanobacillus damuensis]
MRKKSALLIGSVGVLALSIGFMAELKSTEVMAKEQPKTESVVIGQADIDAGDQYRFVTVEEQKMRENPVEDGDRYTVITVEEQNMVENSSELSGFVPQENGTGFFFTKE